MEHRITESNWATQIAAALKSAADGDTIVVPTEAAKQLAERAKARMCPDKRLTIVVDESR